METQYEAAVVDILSSRFEASQLGFAADGVTDDTAAINAKIAEAADWGGLLIIPPGTYKLDGTLINAGKSVRVVAYGAVFVKDTETDAVDFEGAFESTVAVSAITPGVIFGTTRGVTLTVSGTMPWKRGDVVKLFADNVLPETLVDVAVPAAETARVGQFMTVYSVAANSVVLLGDLIDPMTVNVRVARLADVTTVWEGGSFTVTDAYVAASERLGTFRCAKLRKPVIRDVRMSRTGSSAFVMNSNFGYRVENCEVAWAKDDAGGGHYGYGVSDSLSMYGVVDGCRFFQPRHGYTTNYSVATAGEDVPQSYGRAFGAKIVNCLVESASSAAFDTHSDGERIEFINCLALNSPIGFQMRGRRNRITGCSVRQASTAVRLASDSDAGQCWGHTVDALSAENVATVFSIRTRHGGVHPDNGVRDTRPNTIRNVHAWGVTSQGWDLLNTTVAAENVNVEYTGAVSAAFVINSISNSALTAGRLRFDMTSASGTGAYLFSVTGSNPFEVQKLRVNGFSGLGTLLAQAVTIVSGTPEIRVDAIMDHLPSGGFSTASLGANSWMKWSANVGVNNSSSAYKALTDATVQADIIQAVTRRRDPVVVIEYTLPGSQTLANLPNAQQGQVLIIQNSSTTGRNLTVTHGTTPNTNLAGATNKTVAPGQQIMLVYASGIWNHRTAV